MESLKILNLFIKYAFDSVIVEIKLGWGISNTCDISRTSVYCSFPQNFLILLPQEGLISRRMQTLNRFLKPVIYINYPTYDTHPDLLLCSRLCIQIWLFVFHNKDKFEAVGAIVSVYHLFILINANTMYLFKWNCFDLAFPREGLRWSKETGAYDWNRTASSQKKVARINSARVPTNS